MIRPQTVLLALILVGLLSLTGCATQGASEHPEQASYIMVSRGEASLLYRAFMGGLDYCKVTQYNLKSIVFAGEMRYDGDTCVLTITAED